MENEYIVSARKYRPQTFDSVIGQQALTETLKNAIHEGKLAHAYLFCGPRGVGKTTCARIFAKTINCEHPTENGEACNECESCKAFNENRSLNIHEMDAASNNSVEDIRQIVEQVHIPPQVGKYKVFIIDEVHMLSSQAFNAFLKTLEEPPAHVIFILATTEKQKIIPTILSRCQIYDFNRMSVSDITKHLETIASLEQYKYDGEALNVIAQKADGGMRDALSILDQIANYTKGEIFYKNVIRNLNVLDYDYYFKVTDAFLRRDAVSSLLLFNDILNKGFDGLQFINGLAEHFRNLFVSSDPKTLSLLEVSDETKQRYLEQARQCKIKFLYTALSVCNNCSLNYRANSNKRLSIEITLIQLAQTAEESDASKPGGLGPMSKKISPVFNPKEKESQKKSIPSNEKPHKQEVEVNNTVGASTEKKPLIEKEVPDSDNITKSNSAKSYQVSSFKKLLKKENPPSFINKVDKETKAESPSPIPSLKEELGEKPKRELSQNEINIEWVRFANQLPVKDVALAQRMKNITPKQGNTNAHYVIEVENEQIKEYFNTVLHSLEEHFQNSFQRPDFSFSILVQNSEKINSSEESSITPQDQYQQIIEEYKVMTKLKNGLNLELM